jgi:hypothetical protein
MSIIAQQKQQSKHNYLARGAENYALYTHTPNSVSVSSNSPKKFFVRNFQMISWHVYL